MKMTKMYCLKSPIYYVKCGLASADYSLYNILELKMYLALFEISVHLDTLLKKLRFEFSINVNGQ